eukprot:gene5545-6230_t
MSSWKTSEQTVFSPMTELAINFQENCKSYSSTPRRRLSLSDIGNTPTPIKSQSRTDSVESGIFLDGDVPESPMFMSVRQAALRRCNSMQTASSAFEPLAFKLSDDEKSPGKNATISPNSGEEKGFSTELNAFGLPEDLKCATDMSNDILNRSASAPPVLDSLEKYFEDLDEDSNSSTKTDGFDFIEDDRSNGSSSNNNSNHGNSPSLPVGFSGLLGGTIINKEYVKPRTRTLSRSVSEHDKENFCQLTDKENIIYENKPLEDKVFEDTVFKRPSLLIRKVQKRSVSFSVKRTDSQRDFSPVSSKRSRYRSQSLFNTDDQFKSPLLKQHNPSPSRLARSWSVDGGEPSKEDSFKAFAALEDSNLIGDKSKPCCLPVLEERQHRDLKSISPETLNAVLNDKYSGTVGQVVVVDCRYPYEYNGGHIKGAINIYTKEDIIEHFLKKPLAKSEKRNIIIFHCEFSSKRAPSLSRFLRNKDRDIHTNCYPRLYYPELYYLEVATKHSLKNARKCVSPASI